MNPRITHKTWTAEDDAEVVRMLAMGFSCGKIAQEMGVTRNSVIGRAHRLRLSISSRPAMKAEHKQSHPRYKRVRSPKPMHVRSAPQRALPQPVQPPKRLKTGVTLLDLEVWQCHAPIGHNGRLTIYCGTMPVVDVSRRPYCPAHALQFYRYWTGQDGEMGDGE